MGLNYILTIKKLNELMEGAEKYKAWNGKYYYRTFSNLDWYLLQCGKLGLTPKVKASGLSYEAMNSFIEFDYCEHDIIFRPLRVVAGTGENGEEGEQLTYTIIDNINRGLEIWNIGGRAPKNMIPLTLDDGSYSINKQNMFAIITPEAQAVMQGTGFCRDSIKARREYVAKHKHNEPNICERIEKAIEILEKIDKRS